MKVKMWLRSKLSGKKTPTRTTPHHHQTSFLDLPGELRNKIYAYALFPRVGTITAANANKPHHLATSMLASPLFRASQQIRAEALSYLCATLSSQFFGISVANLFFACVGEAVREIKHVSLLQQLSEFPDSREGAERVERFFGFVGKIEGLKRFEIMSRGGTDLSGEMMVFREFMKRVEALEERGVEVVLMFGGPEAVRLEGVGGS
jgi:hypothetical protein